jgi:hypothetical protein
METLSFAGKVASESSSIEECVQPFFEFEFLCPSQNVLANVTASETLPNICDGVSHAECPLASLSLTYSSAEDPRTQDTRRPIPFDSTR